MKDLKLAREPAAKAEMLIRKPVAEVFEAFINPEITTKFWFTKSSGKLEAGTKDATLRGDDERLNAVNETLLETIQLDSLS